MRDEFNGGGGGVAYVFRRDAQGHVSGLDVYTGAFATSTSLALRMEC